MYVIANAAIDISDVTSELTTEQLYWTLMDERGGFK